MAKKTSYDFERKMLDHLLPKSEEEQDLLAGNDITENDLLEMNQFLDSVSEWSQTDDIRPSASVKAELLSGFDKKRKRTGVIWLNSFALWLFPKDRPVINTPGVRLALVSACVVVIVLVVNMSGSVREKNKVAQGTPPGKAERNEVPENQETIKTEDEIGIDGLDENSKDKQGQGIHGPLETDMDRVSEVSKEGKNSGLEVEKAEAPRDLHEIDDVEWNAVNYRSEGTTASGESLHTNSYVDGVDSTYVMNLAAPPAPPDGYFPGSVRESSRLADTHSDLQADERKDKELSKSEELIAVQNAKSDTRKRQRGNKQLTAANTEVNTGSGVVRKSVNLASQADDIIGLLYTAK